MAFLGWALLGSPGICKCCLCTCGERIVCGTFVVVAVVVTLNQRQNSYLSSAAARKCLVPSSMAVSDTSAPMRHWNTAALLEMKTNHCKLLQGSNAHKALRVEAFSTRQFQQKWPIPMQDFSTLCVSWSLFLWCSDFWISTITSASFIIHTDYISQVHVDTFVSRGLLKKHRFRVFVSLTLGTHTLRYQSSMCWPL